MDKDRLCYTAQRSTELRTVSLCHQGKHSELERSPIRGTMTSVKPFKSKNRDKIELDAKNPNLKKGCGGESRATT